MNTGTPFSKDWMLCLCTSQHFPRPGDHCGRVSGFWPVQEAEVQEDIGRKEPDTGKNSSSR